MLMVCIRMFMYWPFSIDTIGGFSRSAQLHEWVSEYVYVCVHMVVWFLCDTTCASYVTPDIPEVKIFMNDSTMPELLSLYLTGFLFMHFLPLSPLCASSTISEQFYCTYVCVFSSFQWCAKQFLEFQFCGVDLQARTTILPHTALDIWSVLTWKVQEVEISLFTNFQVWLLTEQLWSIFPVSIVVLYYGLFLNVPILATRFTTAEKLNNLLINFCLCPV
jgi:hypothetical protein